MVVSFMKFLDFLDKILTILYPDKCNYCDKIINPGEPCCFECYEKIDNKGRIRNIDIDGERQIKCISFSEYSDIFREAIIRYKFHGKKYYYRYFSLLLSYIAETFKELEDFDYITFVPMEGKDKFQRGYNQSELLAKGLSKNSDIPYLGLLKKVKKTLHQHDLDAFDRYLNVLNAYDINSNYAAEICDSKIILCDDVVTTGNTLKECSKVLLDYGAKKVTCLTLAWAK